MPEIANRLHGCLAGGAIGDAIGSFYEGRSEICRQALIGVFRGDQGNMLRGMGRP